VLSPVAGAALSAAILGVGFSTLRGVGSVVARLVTRCADKSVEKAAQSAGRGGAWVFWLIVAVAGAAAFPILARGGGNAAAFGTLALAVDRAILSLGVIGTVFSSSRSRSR
jgi:hypothetical protein